MISNAMFFFLFLFFTSCFKCLLNNSQIINHKDLEKNQNNIISAGANQRSKYSTFSKTVENSIAKIFFLITYIPFKNLLF